MNFAKRRLLAASRVRKFHNMWLCWLIMYSASSIRTTSVWCWLFSKTSCVKHRSALPSFVRATTWRRRQSATSDQWRLNHEPHRRFALSLQLYRPILSDTLASVAATWGSVVRHTFLLVLSILCLHWALYSTAHNRYSPSCDRECVWETE